MDTRTGEITAAADYPTYNANEPAEAAEEDLGSRAASDVYEPGSVEKVLTFGALIDAGKITPRTRLQVPEKLTRNGATIGDHWDHGDIRLTAAGALAKSSNLGTILVADAFSNDDLHGTRSEERRVGKGWVSRE